MSKSTIGKGGRPSKPTDEKRTHVVTIKLNDAEYSALLVRSKSRRSKDGGVCQTRRVPAHYRQPSE